MNLNLRAILFGSVVAAALTTTFNVIAAEAPQVIRLEGIEVTAHRDVAFEAEGVVRLEPIVVTAHKTAV